MTDSYTSKPETLASRSSPESNRRPTNLELADEFEGDLEGEVAEFLQQVLLLVSDPHQQSVFSLLHAHRVLTGTQNDCIISVEKR